MGTFEDAEVFESRATTSITTEIPQGCEEEMELLHQDFVNMCILSLSVGTTGTQGGQNSRSKTVFTLKDFGSLQMEIHVEKRESRRQPPEIVSFGMHQFSGLTLVFTGDAELEEFINVMKSATQALEDQRARNSQLQRGIEKIRERAAEALREKE